MHAWLIGKSISSVGYSSFHEFSFDEKDRFHHKGMHIHNHISGGFDGSLCLRSCEVYDIDKNEWSFIPEMLNTRSGLRCVAHNGLIYVIGGYNGISRLTAAEKFNPILNYWTPINDMNCPRSNFGAEVIEDEIFVTGGFDGLSTINKVECYKIKENLWYFRILSIFIWSNNLKKIFFSFF